MNPSAPPQHQNFNTNVSYMRSLTPRMLIAAREASIPDPPLNVMPKIYSIMGTTAVLLVLGGLVVVVSLKMSSLWKKYISVS